MSSMESSLQELKQLLSNTLSDDDHLKISEIFCGKNVDNENSSNIDNEIPDLITPPNTHRDNNENNSKSNEDTKMCKDTNESIMDNLFVNEELKSCNKLLTENDVFVFNMTNILFTVLLLTELIHLFLDFNRTSVSLLLFNSLMFLFYNSNKDIMIDTQNDILKNSSKYFRKLTSFVKDKSNSFFTYFMDYFFSKNTQMIIKFAYNITKMKVITTYRHYRDQLFNPPLLIQTNKDNVYTVSFYLNGETYKIPVVVPRFSFNKKQPPLMVLNKDEDDITQNILKYMGPNYDFYGMTLKPKHLNENSLNFMIEDGSEMTFLENDLMVL